MAKVIVFPKQKLPTVVEELLFVAAKGYVEALYAAIELLSYDDAEDQERMDIADMVANTFAEGIDKAIDELE